MGEKSAYERWKENLGDTRPWDLIDPNTHFATDEKAEERFNICKSCPEIISFTKQCKKCGCFMFGKTKIDSAQCPIGKW